MGGPINSITLYSKLRNIETICVYKIDLEWKPCFQLELTVIPYGKKRNKKCQQKLQENIGNVLCNDTQSRSHVIAVCTASSVQHSGVWYFYIHFLLSFLLSLFLSLLKYTNFCGKNRYQAYFLFIWHQPTRILITHTNIYRTIFYGIW